MSYSIHYGPSKQDKSEKHEKIALWPLIATVVVPAVLLSMWKHTESEKAGEKLLFPWEQAYVQEAFSDFSASVKEGERFTYAAAQLYQQIVQGDQSGK